MPLFFFRIGSLTNLQLAMTEHSSFKINIVHQAMFFLISDQLYGFIDAGVEVEDIEQNYKFSILNFVLKSRHESKDVKKFLERGANINFYEDENDGDDSVLIRAINSYYAIEEDVRLLVEHGADPHQTDSSGLTTLQLIFQNRKSNIYKNNINH